MIGHQNHLVNSGDVDEPVSEHDSELSIKGAKP